MSPTINVTSCANENAQSKSARRAFCSACMRIGAKSAAKSPTGSQPTPGTSSQIQGVVARWDTWETFFPPITGDRKAREGEQGRECIRNRWAAKSPTTPKRAGAIADQGNPWESGGSRKADLGDFQPLKSDRGRRHSCLFHGHEFTGRLLPLSAFCDDLASGLRKWQKSVTRVPRRPSPALCSLCFLGLVM
jgi:hypothetical protein